MPISPTTSGGSREPAAPGSETNTTSAAEATTDRSEEGAIVGLSAQAQLREAKDQVVEQARTYFRQARDRAGSGVAESRQQASERIGGVARAFRRTGEQLRAENHGPSANLAESLAQHVDQASSYVRDSDVTKMRNDLERLARRKPAAVLGVTFVLGLLAARFFKTSGRGTVTTGGLDA